MSIKLRRQFSLLRPPTPLIYFDSACSALKPISVIKATIDYYENYPACAGRSLHRLASSVNAKISAARQTIANFIGARADEIIFTKNTTESINLIAHSLSWQSGDVILTTDKEHNSNFLPWLALKNKGVKTVIISTVNGQIKFSLLSAALKTHRSRLLTISLTSNLDGLALPAKKIINEAKKYNCLVLLDTAQTLLHSRLNVKTLGADFAAFSSSKICGPTGVGVLVIKNIKNLRPLLLGGGAVKSLTNEKVELLPGPAGFEAGTQNYAGILGLAAAIDFLKTLNFKTIQTHETELKNLLQFGLAKLPGVKLINPTPPRVHSSIVSFYVAGRDSHSLTIRLDQKYKILLRSGNFCNSYYFNKYRLPPALRVSLAFYNTASEIKTFLSALKSLLK